MDKTQQEASRIAPGHWWVKIGGITFEVDLDSTSHDPFKRGWRWSFIPGYLTAGVPYRAPEKHKPAPTRQGAIREIHAWIEDLKSRGAL